jgi:hypothetical protein
LPEVCRKGRDRICGEGRLVLKQPSKPKAWKVPSHFETTIHLRKTHNFVKIILTPFESQATMLFYEKWFGVPIMVSFIVAWSAPGGFYFHTTIIFHAAGL